MEQYLESGLGFLFLYHPSLGTFEQEYTILCLVYILNSVVALASLVLTDFGFLSHFVCTIVVAMEQALTILLFS